MDFINRLNHAISGAQENLWSHISPEGRILGGCEGRLLETALTLHLLRVLECNDELQQRMAQFCWRFSGAARSLKGSKATYFDRLLSLVMATRALGKTLAEEEFEQLQRTLEKFSHPTQWRKRALVESLLADMRAVDCRVNLLSWEEVHDSGNQAWIVPILGGVRILQAHQRGELDAIDKGEVLELCEMQNQRGSWGQHIFGTAVILLALARVQRSGRVGPTTTHMSTTATTAAAAAADKAFDAAEANVVAETLERGLAFVLSHVREDGGVPFIPDEDTWVTCMGGLALLESGAFPTRLDRSIEYLRQQQRDNGGWAYTEGVEQTDADDSSMGLLLMARHGRAQNYDVIRKAVRYLAALQNEDGGFPTFLHGASSEAEITAKAIRAMSALGQAQEADLQKAWIWLLANQAEDGSFRTEWNACTTFPILHVMAAIASCRHLASQIDLTGLQERCVSYLLRHRRADGGWPMAPGDASSHPLSTAYALGALAYAGGVLSTAELKRSVEYLLQHQEDDGSFSSEADSLGPRPFIYDVPVLATIYSMWALSRVREAVLERDLAEEWSAVPRTWQRLRPVSNG